MAAKHTEDDILVTPPKESMITRFTRELLAFANVMGLHQKPEPSRDIFRPLSTKRSCTPRPDIRIEYTATVCGNKASIAMEDIPSFLYDNGITMMDAKKLEDMIVSKLKHSMKLSECTCVGKQGVAGNTQVATLCEHSPQALGRGDVRLRMKMEEDFQLYQDSPKEYEDRLKSAILDALGLDPAILSNAKRHIVIEKVKEGSIHIWLIIKACVLAASAFVFGAAYMESRSNQQRRTRPSQSRQNTRGSGSGQRADAVPSQQQNQPGQPPARQTGAIQTLVPQKQISEETRDWQVIVPTSHSSSWSEHQPAIRTAFNEVRFINNPNDDGWEIVGRINNSPKCYLPSIIFQTSLDSWTTAAKLKEYDNVLGATGEKLTVVFKKVHEKSKRDLITIITAQSVLTVTADHRVVVPGGSGIKDEVLASELKQGAFVYCGQREQKVTKLIPFKQAVQVVEIGFHPDGAVETFNALKWGILTKGRIPGWHLSRCGSVDEDATPGAGSRRRILSWHAGDSAEV